MVCNDLPHRTERYRGKLYKQVYAKRHVTPYIHIIGCHTSTIMERTQLPLADFSQQGFEATHKWHKSIYFHGTSHDGGKLRSYEITSAIKQIITKIYRVHLMEIFGSTEACRKELLK